MSDNNTPTPRIHEDMEPFATRSLAEIHDEILRLLLDDDAVFVICGPPGEREPIPYRVTSNPRWLGKRPLDALQPQCNEVTESPGSNPVNSAPITAPVERE